MPSHNPTHAPSYASLQPHALHISSSKILKKWKPLPPPSQERIKTLLLALKAESAATRRNANLRNQKASKKLDLSDAQWEGVVDALVDKLVSRLPRMPFPPRPNSASEAKGAEGGDFDFEGTLDRINMLEGELSVNVESSKVLREQIKREEAMLKHDKEEYRRLEEGVRSERGLARTQEGRLHSIARGVEVDEDQHGESGRFGNERERIEEHQMEESGQSWQTRRTRKQKTDALTTAEVENDPHLAPLVKQLRSHLGSMQNNTASLKPVKEALEDAEGALSSFAWKSLRREQYEKVVGLNT